MFILILAIELDGGNTMARMYSRERGQSGSHKPLRKTKPSWLRYKAKEIEMLVAKLGKEGKTASAIGITLRDTYGVPDVKFITGKRISDILAGKKLAPEIPDDLRALIKRWVTIRRHLDENKMDQPAKRGLDLTMSKINRLIKYYKKTGKLAADWKFDVNKASFYLE